jgi:hypothetical protein
MKGGRITRCHTNRGVKRDNWSKSDVKNDCTTTVDGKHVNNEE